MKVLLISLSILISFSVKAQEKQYYPDTTAGISQRLEDWQDLKFGLLMHWGTYSQWGIVESWSICPEDLSWATGGRKPGVADDYFSYVQNYEALQKSFNPVNFNPQKWAKAAQYAGMKYVVFTTKHHDGFCMFDTKETGYKVTDNACAFSKNTKSNIAKEIFDAFRKENFWTGAYFSKPVEVKNEFATEWFAGRLNEAKTEVDNLIKQFRLSEALKTIYSLIWDDFCSWYLEWVKPAFEQPMETPVYEKTIGYFSELMQLLHPFMPFITEEIYQQLTTQKGDLCVTQYPSPEKINQQVLQNGILLKTSITGLRDVRNKQQLKPKDAITLHIQTANEVVFKAIVPILAKQVNAKSILFTQAAINNTITCVIGKDKFYLETEQPLNTEKQKADLEKELLHHKGFLATVDKKLGNEKFVQNAKPEVIALEKKKKADAEMKIKIIEESLATL